MNRDEMITTLTLLDWVPVEVPQLEGNPGDYWRNGGRGLWSQYGPGEQWYTETLTNGRVFPELPMLNISTPKLADAFVYLVTL